MMIEIKHRFTGAVICSFDVATMKDAVSEAIKSGAYLRGAYLRGADLRGADLRGADLRGADLGGAYLRGADLRGADLVGADLRGADLRGAYLGGAYLGGADLGWAYLGGAYLRGAKNLSNLVIAQNSIVSEGQVIGWKKLRNGVIAKLSIPANAKRLNSIGSRKCRASMAFVLELSEGQTAYDKHTGKLEYKVGEFVTPDTFDDDIYVECSHGIHFFLTKIEAENY